MKKVLLQQQAGEVLNVFCQRSRAYLALGTSWDRQMLGHHHLRHSSGRKSFCKSLLAYPARKTGSPKALIKKVAGGYLCGLATEESFWVCLTSFLDEVSFKEARTTMQATNKTAMKTRTMYHSFRLHVARAGHGFCAGHLWRLPQATKEKWMRPANITGHCQGCSGKNPGIP